MKNHLVVAVAPEPPDGVECGQAIALFSRPAAEAGADWYDFAVCPAAAASIHGGDAWSPQAQACAMLERAGTIIFPGWGGYRLPPAPLLERIRAAHARGARLCAMSSGAMSSGVFVLAAAGVLDGKRAAAGHGAAGLLAQRYPAINVKAGTLFVDAGQILTSAGSAAGLDMLLHLVRRDHGSRIAGMAAQGMAAWLHESQAAMEGKEAAELSRLIAWLREHPSLPHTLESMAGRAGMNTGALQREFQAATGMGPEEWLAQERVALVRNLLGIPLGHLE
ncbi:MAG TPA: AraC family transcriptional regulator [Janthinobacterium sp.]|jgi:AraC family transcriptional activator FtrA|nr:AraC family transcriptional regulator [Janthinobacterium sp.]